MNIQHNQQEGRFFITEEGDDVAEMTYRLDDRQQMLIDHTWVDERLEGKGIARQLLDAAVSFAVAEGLKIVPYCAYVKAQFARHPEQYAHVAA